MDARLRIGVGVLLAAFTLAAFWPALSGGFVDWDDEQNFLHNLDFRGLGWPNVRWAFTTYHLGVYQPVAWLLLEAEYCLFGLAPGGYHLVSLAFHVANVLLLFGLTRELLRRGSPALWARASTEATLAAGAAALLFAVHPLRTETVAWASCQPYQPAFFFSFLALRAYLAWTAAGPGRRARWAAVTFTMTVAAMASKAVAVTLPLLFVLLDIHPLQRIGPARGWWRGPGVVAVWREKIPFLLAAGWFAHLAARAKAHVNALAPLAHDGWGERIAHAGYAAVFYIAKTLVPTGLASYYPRPLDISLAQPIYLAAVAAVVGVTALAWARARRWPALAAAWAAYLLVLAPNSGLVRTSEQIAADRYSYLASTALVVLIAALAWDVLVDLRAGGRKVAAVWLLAAALISVAASRRQAGFWHDTEAVWTRAFVLRGERDGILQNNYGALLTNKGRYEEALAHLDRALALQPFNGDAHRNRGAALYWLGRHAEAMAEAREALRRSPRDAEAHLLAGACALDLDHPGEAAPHFEEFFKTRENPTARLKLGTALFRLARTVEAVAAFRKAIELEPRMALAHLHLGWALFKAGDARTAVEEITRSIALDPGDAGAYYHLGEVQLAQGLTTEAVRNLEEATTRAPEFAAAREALARVRGAGKVP